MLEFLPPTGSVIEVFHASESIGTGILLAANNEAIKWIDLNDKSVHVTNLAVSNIRVIQNL